MTNLHVFIKHFGQAILICMFMPSLNVEYRCMDLEKLLNTNCHAYNNTISNLWFIYIHGLK